MVEEMEEYTLKKCIGDEVQMEAHNFDTVPSYHLSYNNTLLPPFSRALKSLSYSNGLKSYIENRTKN